MDLDTEKGMGEAKVWMSDLLSLIKDGGFWTVPRSLSTYQVWSSTKEYAHIHKGEACIDRVFNALGYNQRRKSA